MRSTKQQYIYISFIVITILLFSQCAAHKKEFNKGSEAFGQKKWDQAVKYLLEAVEKQPDNVEYRISLSKALIAASNDHLTRGIKFARDKQFKPSLFEFDKALEFNSENNEARRQKYLTLKEIDELKKKYRQKTKIQRLKEEAKKKELADAANGLTEKVMEFKIINQPIRNIFKALGKATGVNFLFDEGIKKGKMSLDLTGVSLIDVLDAIEMQSKVFYKIINHKTILIIPDVKDKRKLYEEQVMKTFFLSNADPEEIQKIVQVLTGIRTMAINKTLNSITITEVPGKLKMAEKIIQVNDKPRGELMLEIEVMEVNKKTVNEYGIELSNYNIGEVYSPGPVGEESGSSTIRLNSLKYTDASDFLLTLPSLNYKLLKYNNRSKIKARPRLRIMDKEEVEVHLGDKVPIPQTTFVPQYGTDSPKQQSITSYKMEDIGINIKITPRMHHDGLISLKMHFELTFITDPGTQTLPPTIGNRTVDTMLRLRDNETTILAGLLRDTERKSLRGIPLLSSVPVLKDIFSGNKKEIDQTDILITITPRIVRFPEINPEDLEYLWVGTKERPELKESPPFELKKEEEAEEEPVVTPVPENTQVSPQAGKESGGPVQEKKTPKKEEKEPVDYRQITLEVPAGEIEQGKEFQLPINLDRLQGVGLVKLELQIDSSRFELKGVEKGLVLKNHQTRSQFSHTYNKDLGKIKIFIRLDGKNPDQYNELALLTLVAKKGGPGKIEALLAQTFSHKMKPMPCKANNVTIEVKNP